ncbi:ABC-type spermidine/putrescine transport system, permease component II [Gottschalkia purinilytica]|uniref:ABC-type spermidine/putrescine transport system, permease component II n=1 Tax=Gottschalkia purinilytica TaxID=1503 RepID=A0A0L0W7H2_GOTPU|nr:ABC transporter permease subunit [Gottschalkia purinilytica]KNF07260.1 ABC-type spermidine/putrescine transport system, permease component II [Gottschalkia purinilytica]
MKYKYKLKPYILLTPVMIVILGIFVTGIVMGFLQSIGYFPIVGLKDFTLKYYKEVMMSKDFLSSLIFSIYISFISSALSVILGVALAYLIYRKKEKKGVEDIVFKVPIIVPHIVAVLLVYNLLSQSGIISRIFYSLGFVSSQNHFPSLLFEKNGIGIIITYLWKEIPFIGMVVYSVLNNMNNKFSDVAKTLGANRRQVFFKVTLPLIMPSIVTSFILVFAFSFGAFEVPFLLGPTNPKALPVKAYIEYSNPDLKHRPYTMVINMILTFVSLILVWGYNKAFKVISKYNR